MRRMCLIPKELRGSHSRHGPLYAVVLIGCVMYVPGAITSCAEEQEAQPRIEQLTSQELPGTDNKSRNPVTSSASAGDSIANTLTGLFFGAMPAQAVKTKSKTQYSSPANLLLALQASLQSRDLVALLTCFNYVDQDCFDYAMALCSPVLESRARIYLHKILARQFGESAMQAITDRMERKGKDSRLEDLVLENPLNSPVWQFGGYAAFEESADAARVLPIDGTHAVLVSGMGEPFADLQLLENGSGPESWRIVVPFRQLGIERNKAFVAALQDSSIMPLVRAHTYAYVVRYVLYSKPTEQEVADYWLMVKSQLGSALVAQRLAKNSKSDKAESGQVGPFPIVGARGINRFLSPTSGASVSPTDHEFLFDFTPLPEMNDSDFIKGRAKRESISVASRPERPDNIPQEKWNEILRDIERQASDTAKSGIKYELHGDPDDYDIQYEIERHWDVDCNDVIRALPSSQQPTLDQLDNLKLYYDKLVQKWENKRG